MNNLIGIGKRFLKLNTKMSKLRAHYLESETLSIKLKIPKSLLHLQERVKRLFSIYRVKKMQKRGLLKRPHPLIILRLMK